MGMNAIYAGSFDPFTNGHLHVLCEASKIFETVYVVTAVNCDKKRRTDPIAMQKAMREVCKSYGMDNVGFTQDIGLVADFARGFGIEYLVRGIRNGIDYAYEENMAQINEKLGLKTIYIRAGELGYISSSMVMELYKYGKDISEYVPDPVLALLK